jgi:hypothetical protein
LSKDAKELSKTTITSPSDSTEIVVDYNSRKLIKNINIPYEVVIKITTPRNVMYIKLEYEKVEVDEPQELLIIISTSSLGKSTINKSKLTILSHKLDTILKDLIIAKINLIAIDAV